MIGINFLKRFVNPYNCISSNSEYFYLISLTFSELGLIILFNSTSSNQHSESTHNVSNFK